MNLTIKYSLDYQIEYRQIGSISDPFTALSHQWLGMPLSALIRENTILLNYF